jgi:molybdenum cofactor synthesis domain-containing protein
MQISVGIITISDRAFRGVYPDISGPALRQAADGYGWQTVAQMVVPDDKAEIQRAIRAQIAAGRRLILTTGGTGVALGDVTPEAVRELAARELPGFGEIMRRESQRLTPHGILSRSLAVVMDRVLVVCLPGNPRGAVECLGFVAPAIPHCLELLEDGTEDSPQRHGRGSRHHATETDSVEPEAGGALVAGPRA